MALLALVAVLGWSQQDSGAINGRVLDSTASAIAGAELVLTHVETGAVRKATAGADGAYAFPVLAIGSYQISATHPGFKKAVKSGLELHIGDRLDVDLRLDVGDLAVEVSVTADAVQVETESSEQSGLISGEQVRELQLNGRSFMTLVELLPGVASEMPDRTDPNTQSELYINGNRKSGSGYNVDGANNNDVIIGGGQLNTFTSVETIAEFKVQTSTFAAEHGRGGVSQISVVTRGGTRGLHGSLYEFARNDAFDARDYFTHQVLPLKLNNFGYTLSGPVSLFGYNRDRKKTFFFWAQEFNRTTARGEAVNTTVPTLEERQGDFRARGAGADGLFGTADDAIIDPLSSLGFPDGIIPRSRIDANAAKFISIYPAPNFQGVGALNYTSAVPGHQNWREELIRIDHNLSDRWKLYARYAQDSSTIVNPYGGSYTLLNKAGSKVPGISPARAQRPGVNLSVSATTVLNQGLLNEFRFGWTSKEMTQRTLSDYADRTAFGIRIPEIFPENVGNLIPEISLGSNYAGINMDLPNLKQLFNTEVSDNVTVIRGRHMFKVGGVYSFGGNDELRASGNTNGQFTFDTKYSRNPVSNLLLGLPFTYTEEEFAAMSRIRFGFLELFAQDDIRATNRLTLNVGVRWSNYYNPYDTTDMMTNFVPSLWDPARAPRIDGATGRPVPGTGDPLNGIVVAGKDSPWGRRTTANNTNLLGPRFGFAWDVLGSRKTAVRGGYGIYYARPMLGAYINNAWTNPPFSHSVTLQQPLLSNPGGGTEAPLNVSNLIGIGTPLLAPTTQQWSFGVQQDVFDLGVLEVSYVGSRGTHLQRPININSPLPGAANFWKVNVAAVRPYLGYGNINIRETSASSIYHSLQARYSLRMGRAYKMGVAYTFSKSIDDGSAERENGEQPPDMRNIRAERGPSNFDRKHILTANFIWNLPRLARGVLDRPGMRLLLNGWEFSGITRMWSGTPFDVVLSQDVANIGGVQNQRPDVIGDTRGPRTTEEWFNRGAFARPAPGTFGNMGRNSLRRPGVYKWDLSLFKNFKAGERARMQFRSEFFNAFNHPSFTTVGSTLNTTATGVNPAANSFGVVTGTRDARVLQFGLKMSF